MTLRDSNALSLDTAATIRYTAKPSPLAARSLGTGSNGEKRPLKSNRLLLSNIAWMLLGNVAYGFSQWGQLVALAKVGTIEMVGDFALALAVCLPVLMCSSLSLRSLQVTDHQHSHRFLEYMSLRLLTLFISLELIFAFGVFTGIRHDTVILTALVGAARAVEYISDILYGSLQQQEDMSGIAISMSLRALLSVGALSAGVFETHSLLWGAFWMFLASSVVLLAYDIPKALTLRKIHLSVALSEFRLYLRTAAAIEGQKRLWRLAMAGLPMGLALMMVSLNLNIPRYFIQQHLGTQQLAIFSAIATLLAAGNTITNAAGQAVAPRMAKCFALGDRRGFGTLLAALIAGSLGLGGLGFAGALLFGKQAMAMIYRPEFAGHHDVLLWLTGASGFFYLGSTLGYAVTAVRCFAPQLPLFAGAAVTTAIACFVLIPTQGLRGAAIAILISAAVQCVGSAALLWIAQRKAPAGNFAILRRATDSL